jgi:poly(3-hydroxybutyrate) depolymerase
VYDSASITKLYYFDLSRRSHQEVALNWERGVGGGFVPIDDGVLVLLANGVRDILAHYRKQNDSFVRQAVTGTHSANIHSIEAAAGSETSLVAYEYSTASEPAQWFTATLSNGTLGEPTQATKMNGGLQEKTISKSETIRWKGALDEEVEGLLLYPHNYEAGKKYPLVVMIHGGPAALDKDYFRESWAYPHQLYTQRGAFVLKPNYHGSAGYGLRWVESIGGGKYNDLEWIDVETGVDSLIAKGLADPDKLAVMGWSNGSIISIELSTRTTRYKAVGAGAGNVNWISDWGNAMFGHAFDDYYLGSTPIQDPERYVAKSPLFRMDKVKSPTIIFFGTEDVNVPTEQGWQHYRALQHLGNTDVKFVLFPGEPHGLQNYSHQKRKVEEELAWFDRYLFGETSPKSAWLKENAPLSGVIRRANISDPPETALLGDLRVSRFEITRGQYAAFDGSYKVAPGTMHYPATGISFENAKHYAEWLSKKTGKKFRLPTEKEMKNHLVVSKSGNTLDRWAGYSVNPDDAARLAPVVAKLPPDQLLMPVGSFPGKGDDPVFDLDGNAAEWVVTEDGQGKLLGGNAVSAVDSKTYQTPPGEYAGFRVVVE